ncbi:MAG: hypothetical protein LBV43_01055 [Prevotella sp.]|nr:hypothetical protein [Prevotella sp.]
MSSKRKLKKNINEAMDLLYVDCLFYKAYVLDADLEAADKVISNIQEARNDLAKRVNVNEGKEVKDRVKAYYKKLNNDFKKAIDTIGEEIASLGK